MLTFGGLIRHHGHYWGDKDAFVELERRRSWGEYHRRTDALGHALRRLGISPGDRVAILAADCIEVAETFGACTKIGAIRVGLNPRLAAPEIAALIDRLRTVAAVRPHSMHAADRRRSTTVSGH